MLPESHEGKEMPDPESLHPGFKTEPYIFVLVGGDRVVLISLKNFEEWLEDPDSERLGDEEGMGSNLTRGGIDVIIPESGLQEEDLKEAREYVQQYRESLKKRFAPRHVPGLKRFGS